jgi:hypothetical protein
MPMLATALLLALAVQDRTGALPGPDGETNMRPTRQDRACNRDGEGITVCADTMSRERMQALEARFAEKPVRAARKLPGGGEAGVHAVQRSFPGASAPGMMLSVRIPLGGPKKDKKAKAK